MVVQRLFQVDPIGVDEILQGGVDRIGLQANLSVTIFNGPHAVCRLPGPLGACTGTCSKKYQDCGAPFHGNRHKLR